MNNKQLRVIIFNPQQIKTQKSIHALLVIDQKLKTNGRNYAAQKTQLQEF